ncbi:unnamed protein product [Durusdinium trenchii]|uniref:Uncharacterized protein n=1 Tax=Durusdinium trenchii TaxID=1381693 RepID=A0ABP0MM69_9DINO
MQAQSLQERHEVRAAATTRDSWRQAAKSKTGAVFPLPGVPLSPANALLCTWAAEGAWRRCLALWLGGEGKKHERERAFQRWTEPLIAWDLIGCFGAMALGAAPQTWWYCLRVLERMPLLRVLPHLPAYRSAVRACGLGRAEVSLSLGLLEATRAGAATSPEMRNAAVFAFEGAQVPWPRFGAAPGPVAGTTLLQLQ